MKIAIIGSGIAGLASAYRLSQDSANRVTLIERDCRLGLSAQTIQWQPLEPDVPDAKLLAGDVPSRMFNEVQWPQLASLYRQAGVESVVVDSAQSFCHMDQATLGSPDALPPKSYLNLNDAQRPSIAAKLLGSGLLGSGLLGSDSRELLRDAARLRGQGQQDLRRGIEPTETLLAYLQRHGFSDSFRLGFLYPTLSSTVCTCSFQSLDRYPALVILSALNRLTGSEPLRRLKHSARDVADRLTESVPDVRLNCRVHQIEESEHDVEVCFADAAPETFDRVIVATQANTALQLTQRIPDCVQECVAAIDYEDVHVVVHEDARLMPKRSKHWATFNMTSSVDWQQAMCTVWMNRFHNDWPPAKPLFQTINPIVQPENVVAESMLQRPVVTAISQEAIERMKDAQNSGNARILLAGSWADCGVPLLESGVASAWAACEVIQSSKQARANHG